MTTSDAAKIVEEAKPEMAVLTHFGMQMIVRNPTSEAQLVQHETGVPTIAATDRMIIKIGERIQVQATKRQKRLQDFS